MVFRASIVVLVSSCLFGCSTSTSGTSSNVDAGDDGGQVDDAGDAPHPFRQAGCPDALPNEGDPCTSGPECEYGDDPHCRTVARCDSAVGKVPGWNLYRSGACAPNPAGCPAAFTSFATGAACPIDGSCTYAEGRCGCVSCGLDPGDGGTITPGREWSCLPYVVPPTCPAVAPLLGTACPIDQQVCGYGATCCTSVDVGLEIECANGYWREAGGACGCAELLCTK